MLTFQYPGHDLMQSRKMLRS